MTRNQPKSKSPQQPLGQRYRQALALINARQFEAARKICLGIAKETPDEPDVHKLLAMIAYQSKDSAGAITHFQRALTINPDDMGTRLNLAKTYRDFHKFVEAAAVLESAAQCAPGDMSILYDLAKAYQQLGRHGDAARCFRQVLPKSETPNIVETNLATALMNMGAIDDAEAHYTAVIGRAPDFLPALINLAILRDIQGRMDEALAILDRAIALHPQNADIHFHHALALIARGRLAEGWAEYVWRFERPAVTTLHNHFPTPYWNGEPLDGRTLLVWTEQGLGDEILLASMIPDVLERGAQCTLVCTNRLAPLFQHSFPSAKILTREDMKTDIAPARGAHYQASLSQLGFRLRPSFESFPQRKSYLKADEAEASALRTRYLQGSPDRLVGIAWQSGNPQAGAEKSTPLTAWADILRVPGYRFVSLQYGDRTNALRELQEQTGLSITVDEDIRSDRDMRQFAAQVAAMDLVISVSNTTVHFAGALGVPVWTLLPSSVGRIWYWFLDRSDSPWYPSMRLFRQERGKDWSAVLESVARELRQWP